MMKQSRVRRPRIIEYRLPTSISSNIPGKPTFCDWWGGITWQLRKKHLVADDAISVMECCGSSSAKNPPPPSSNHHYNDVRFLTIPFGPHFFLLASSLCLKCDISWSRSEEIAKRWRWSKRKKHNKQITDANPKSFDEILSLQRLILRNLSK